ncbi:MULTISPECIES: NrfD/PsrC family molybdoenzyme membrane anchor subunit [Bacillota]|uniref:NrfD/PsrC family molybdoenzyme membrane anchor subunit n=1 Tax=Bacillota TaxID=1239 RepID=UPI0039F0D675
MRKSNSIWWLVFSILVLIAFLLMYIRINQGLSFTNLNNLVGWGLWVTFYVYFLGISVGLFLSYGLIEIFNLEKYRDLGRVALYSSMVSLLVGLFFILIDIGHLGRFWTVFINRNLTSVLSWELHLYVLYFLVIAVLLFMDNLPSYWKPTDDTKMIKWLSKNRKSIIKYITYFGIPLAIAVHGGTGALFAVVKARAFWNSAIFPVIFLTSATLSGISAIIFFIGFFKRLKYSIGSLRSLSRIFFILLIFDNFLVLLQLFINYYSDINDRVAFINLIFLGDYSKSFWIGQIGIGVILTVLLFCIYFYSDQKFLYLWLSSITCLIGIWFIRMNFIAPTLSVPLIDGLAENMYRSNESFKYTPSIMEWIYSYFIIISGTIIYIFGINRIPNVRDALFRRKIKGDDIEQNI